ncbi:sodium/glutamate symporter [Cyanobacterium stanieri PCC 7202]|uniref:Sodium/glutamate symporter n=1 Tax=Cyanobacterium stanieri (strain ATCC 29140 / PCC 7202) TaxID=292563 RepID=K9YHG7_CYASC|nr:sodium/glutamate symporter [Cyanobacterium stanieri PCC 7202]
MFNLRDALFAFVILAILILVARFIKQKARWIQTLYLPESVVAGFLALILGREALGALITNLGGENALFAGGLFSDSIRTVWQQSPGVFINVVFAALFLGESIPNPKQIWKKAAPQVIFGQTLAWGQYVIGILLTLFILVPVFNMNPLVGSLIEIGFEGGHGTAAGMQQTFIDLDFPEGGDLALGLATVGIVSGIITGTLLASWGRKKGHIKTFKKEGQKFSTYEGLSASEIKEKEEKIKLKRIQLNKNLLIDPLSLNFGFVGLAIGIGWLILEGLKLIESLTWGQTGLTLMIYIPLFPVALIGGIIVQITLEKIGLKELVNRRLMNNLAGLALDIVVVTALASISLQVLGTNIVPFLLLSIIGIIWNIVAFVFIAPKIIPSYWFERGICDFGQSMGVTATGILLLRMVDPDNKSGAFESFAYKQLFFEPIVGGGLFTAAAPVLINEFGSVSILLLTFVLLIVWLVLGFSFFGKDSKQARIAEKING